MGKSVLKFFTQLMAGIAGILAIKFKRIVTDRWMLRRILLAIVVAAAVGFTIFWWLTIAAGVPSDLLPPYTPDLSHGLPTLHARGGSHRPAVPRPPGRTTLVAR